MCSSVMGYRQLTEKLQLVLVNLLLVVLHISSGWKHENPFFQSKFLIQYNFVIHFNEN